MLNSLGGGEDATRVGGDGVDGRRVGPELANEGAVVGIPQLQHAAPAAAQQHGRAPGVRHEAERADPVLVGLVQGLDKRHTLKMTPKDGYTTNNAGVILCQFESCLILHSVRCQRLSIAERAAPRLSIHRTL